MFLLIFGLWEHRVKLYLSSFFIRVLFHKVKSEFGMDGGRYSINAESESMLKIL